MGVEKAKRSIGLGRGPWTLGIVVALTLSGLASGQETLRFATYNVHELAGAASVEEFVQRLSNPGDQQAQMVAHVIQHVRPDVLLLNEFDYDATGQAVQLFQTNFLSQPQTFTATGTTAPIDYPYVYCAESNTGLPSGHDYSNDGTVGGPLGTEAYADDCYGFGEYPGQYAMVVLSKYPLATEDARTFQTFKWKDMPENLRPPWPENEEEDSWYSNEEWETFRLSSKSHWDVPVQVGDETIHVLACHPTPPVFDEPGARENARRNHDEIRFWADYVTAGQGDYIYDDRGATGALPPGEKFVVMGDLNAEPGGGSNWPGTMDGLLENPRVNTDLVPTWEGTINGDSTDTGFGRVDYVLPSADMDMIAAGVAADWYRTPWGAMYNGASDHYMVWADVAVPEPASVLCLGLGGMTLLRRRNHLVV